MPTVVVRRCFVSGLVQGVFFRGSTRERANALGVSGFASNLADGRVEVLAVGELAAVHQLIEWLHRGPPAARVSRVEVLELRIDEIDALPSAFTTH